MARKAIFLDVDGTLVNDFGAVPDSARRAVRAARANGHLIFSCTGQSLPELWDDITAPGFDGVIAAAGGYVEYEAQVLVHTNVAVADVARAVEFFDAHDVEYFPSRRTPGSPPAPGCRTDCTSCSSAPSPTRRSLPSSSVASVPSSSR